MKEVTAYQDSAGRLHRNLREAIESDFIAMVQRAWGQMPDQRDRGDPVVIARILASDTYQSSKVHLREAIAWLDQQKGLTPDPVSAAGESK
jgi:hypothetical protein